MQIEKTTKIGELLDTNPEKAELLLSVGMHCLGCPASRDETLEEADYSREEINQGLNDILDKFGIKIDLK